MVFLTIGETDSAYYSLITILISLYIIHSFIYLFNQPLCIYLQGLEASPIKANYVQCASPSLYKSTKLSTEQINRKKKCQQSKTSNQPTNRKLSPGIKTISGLKIKT